MGVEISFNVVGDMMAELEKALKEMQAKEVLVGFPESEDTRVDEKGNPESITNASLAYIHNFGAPEANIPARPFMVEGIEGVREKITDRMYTVGTAALEGNKQAVDMGLNAVGLTAQLGIQDKINDGPFTPNAPSTVKAKGSDSPLIDTGQLRNAVTFQIREY